VATIATPQESRSFSGLYKPDAGGKLENLLFMLAIKFAPFLFVFLACLLIDSEAGQRWPDG
jgi:hypothetical protein